ncbi:MAG TPA: outer membrane protein assembly factor BamA [Polyangia bacterium]|jgi:outer membrane protein insertion porin family|nr:outer membrane protein assembly factor BamA [Polyangia bacterium]
MSMSRPAKVAYAVLAAALTLGVPGLARAAGGDAEPAPAGETGGEPEKPEASEPAAPATPQLKVAKVQFRGNRKVEDDAIKVNLKTQPGVTLTQELLREDIHTIWKMGYFDDVQVEVQEPSGGRGRSNVVFVLREKPAIKKIYVAGNDEISLSKINEVLDIKKDQILDLAKLKKNVEKIKDLYVEKGFYMAEVSYELKRNTPAEVDVWFRIRENAKVEVRRVNFVGNHAISDAELRDVIVTREGSLLSILTSAGTYREDAFQRDLLLIQAHYWDHGYVQVKVGSPLVELSPDKQSMYITISIDEGPQYTLGKVDVTGDLLESKEFFLSRVSVKPGEIFNRSKLSDDLQRLTDFYKDKGYAYVNASPATPINEKARTVDVIFEIQKGDLVHFDRINIRGNTKTRDKVIRRELRIIEGEPYNQSLLDYSKKRVTALGFFEKVDISTKRGSSDDRMDVNVEVSERPTGTFQIGAGFSSVENFIAQAQISQNNLLGRGTSLTLQAQLSSLRQLFLLQYQDIYFLDTNWTFGFNLFKQDRYLFSFVRRSKGASLTWGYLLAEDLRLLLTYTLEDVSVSTSGFSTLFSGAAIQPVSVGSIANLLRSGITSSGRALLSYDSRDNRMFPTRGWYNTLSGEVADSYPPLFSENVFTRYEGVARYYYPIWGPFVLRMQGQVGLIASRDDKGVPIFERYFVGGIYDVRGFSPRSLGPVIRALSAQSQDSSLRQFLVGGNMQVIGNAEVEFPIFDKVGIRGVVFTDFGNAFNLEKQYCALAPSDVDASKNPCKNPLDLDAYRASWGFGFRWFSPIGPLRFEWGIPFKTLPGEQPIVFEFTIGNFF